MTLGGCPLSIFCSRGTPPRDTSPLPSEEGTPEKGFKDILSESLGQNLVLTVLYLPYSLDWMFARPGRSVLQVDLIYKKAHPPRTLP